MIGSVIAGMVTAAALALLFGYFVMLLWNWLMPELFGIATITYWQAFGVVLLARLIFGGFRQNGFNHKSRYGKRDFIRYSRKKYGKGSSVKDWRYFEDYWAEEGKGAFEQYVDRRKNG